MRPCLQTWMIIEHSAALQWNNIVFVLHFSIRAWKGRAGLVMKETSTGIEGQGNLSYSRSSIVIVTKGQEVLFGTGCVANAAFGYLDKQI